MNEDVKQSSTTETTGTPSAPSQATDSASTGATTPDAPSGPEPAAPLPAPDVNDQDAIPPDETASNAAQERKKRSRKVLRVLVFGALTVTLTAVSAAMFPRTHQVSANTNIRQIAVAMNYTPLELTIEMRPDTKTGGTILQAFEFGADRVVNGRETEDLTAQEITVTLDVPTDTWGAASTCDPADSNVVCSAGLGRKLVSVSGPEGTVYLRIPPSGGAGYGESQNDEYAAAILPPVEVTNDELQPLSTNVNVGYIIPNEDRYTWNTNGQPANHTISSTTYTEWTETTGVLQNPTAETGIWNERRDRDDLFIFIAGALLGLAGAALLSLITELL